MAIALSKYIDITSGRGGNDVVGRRNLCGRVFTQNAVLLETDDRGVMKYENGIAVFHNADDVLGVFGNTSDEYKFSVDYFKFISKSITKADSLSFAYWGGDNDKDEHGVVSPVVALSRVNETDENFGSFCFIGSLTADQIGELAKHNATYNYKYLYSVAVADRSECAAVLAAIGGASGTVVTLDAHGNHLEFIPMVLFASTNYTRVNATKNFMFNQFAGILPSVTKLADAESYDNFRIAGDTTYHVNYIGNTQQAGTLVKFYQDGFNVDGLDTACYCNEVWLKDAVLVNLLNMFLSQEKVPASSVGATMCEHAILSVVDEAIYNGTILPLKNLSNTQKAYVDSLTGVENSWEEIYTKGFWLACKVKSDTKGNRTVYYLDYILVYSQGDSIRKVIGSHALV